MTRLCQIKHYFVDLDDYGCIMRQYDGCGENCVVKCTLDVFCKEKQRDEEAIWELCEIKLINRN